MVTEGRHLSGARIAAAFSVAVVVAALGLTSCDRPATVESTTASSSPSGEEVAGVILRADPNPVPPAGPKGRTVITWDTGTEDVGDVYVYSAGDEKLFASARQGSQEAAWIPPGSTEFRLYTQEGHKPLARLTVTMASSEAARRKSWVAPSATPAVTPSTTASPASSKSP
jgi:hypothetical protein